MLQKICLLCLLLLASCSKKETPFTQKKPLILVSIAPYHFLAKEIAGELFEVQSVVPTTANPHTFEPTSSQVLDISSSDVWFKIGEPFEEKIISILKKRKPELMVADLRDGIDLIDQESSLSCQNCSMDHLDRHIWLSPKLAQKQAMTIERVLSEKFPENALFFKENLSELLNRLNLLDKELQQILVSVPKRTILVSHPAFGYFCKEYDLVQISVEYEGKDPRPKHLEQILKRAVSESMEVALALPQYNNKGAQFIAEKLHLPVRFIDPYSSDYFETMLKLAHIIAEPYVKDN